VRLSSRFNASACGACVRKWPIATDIALQANVRFQVHSDRAPGRPLQGFWGLFFGRLRCSPRACA
jgi:hypothetical protein